MFRGSLSIYVLIELLLNMMVNLQVESKTHSKQADIYRRAKQHVPSGYDLGASPF